MDGSLLAATSAALGGVDRTTHLTNDFVQDVTSSQEALEPVLVDLFGLGGLLDQLRGVGAIPHVLQPSLTRIVWSCCDICKFMDAVLAGCGDGTLRSRRWALTDAPVEIEGLKANMENCTRTLKIVVEALKIGMLNEQIMDDMEDLQQDLTPDQSPLDAMIIDCLEALETVVTGSDEAVPHSEDGKPPLTILPPSPSIHDTMKSFRFSRPYSSHAENAPSHAASKPEQRQIPENNAFSPLETIQDEDLSQEPKVDTASPKSPSSRRRNNSSATRDSMSEPNRIFAPPAHPPPSRALPPLPPPKSTMRQSTITTLSTPPASPPSISSSSFSKPPTIPMRSRARASSDVRRDSKFSTATSGASRYSGSSQASFVVNPSPRSSSYNFSAENHHTTSPRPEAVSEDAAVLAEPTPGLKLVPSRTRLEHAEGHHKDTSSSQSGAGVYYIDTSPACTTLASRHGKFHLRLWDLPSGALLTTLKVPFYVQMQPRSREFFVRSHAILSETLHLVAVASGFGHTLEIWNWARRKKVQTLANAHRWAAARAELHVEASRGGSTSQLEEYPLATYREDDDTITLHPVCAATLLANKKPFGSSGGSGPGGARVLDLRRAGLPHVPKLPELAYSATGPLLVAAAGPRPPRPNAPPPQHAALLVVWRLDTLGSGSRPYKFLQTAIAGSGGGGGSGSGSGGGGGSGGGAVVCPELENSLPLCLATYGSVAVSIWEPAKFRTIGRPGVWQVEPVPVTGRVVLVWDFGGGGDDDDDGDDDSYNNTNNKKVTTYKIPQALSCVSPDCRFVAYCDAGGPGRDGALVVLDAIQGGRELWRLDGGQNSSSSSSRRQTRSGKSFEQQDTSRRSRRSSARSSSSRGSDSTASRGSLSSFLGVAPAPGAAGGCLEALAAGLDRVVELAFSGDGKSLFVGDVDGHVGVYELREGPAGGGGGGGPAGVGIGIAV